MSIYRPIELVMATQDIIFSFLFLLSDISFKNTFHLVMEGKGKVKSSSSSSFTTQLFGPKESVSSSTFNSIFLPSSKGTSRNILSTKPGSLEIRKESATCNPSSSAYYSGQDVYSQSTHKHTYPTVKKDDDDDNSLEASRGNWWQGSLYY